MIPYLNPFEKFIAWLAWHLCRLVGGYDMDKFQDVYAELRDEFPHVSGLLLDYCYIRQARRFE